MDNTINPENIEALVNEFEASGCAELHVRFEGFELHLSTDSATAGESAPTISVARPTVSAVSNSPQPVAAKAAVPPSADDLEGFEVVCAPYLGTFYRAPKPGEPAYVEVGATVSADSELCLVEVMKLFTAVRAGVAGKVARILATDGQMVEAGQPLFAIDAKG